MSKEKSDYDKLKEAATEANEVMRETLELLKDIRHELPILENAILRQKIIKGRDKLKSSIRRLDI